MLDYTLLIGGVRIKLYATNHVLSRMYERYIRLDTVFNLMEDSEDILDLPLSDWCGSHICLYYNRYDLSIPVVLERDSAGNLSICIKTVFRGKSKYSDSRQRCLVL